MFGPPCTVVWQAAHRGKSAFPASGSPVLYGAGRVATSALTCAGVSGGGGGAAVPDEEDDPPCPQPARARPVATKAMTGVRIRRKLRGRESPARALLGARIER